MQAAKRHFRNAGVQRSAFAVEALCSADPMDVTPAALAVHAQIMKLLPIARASGKKVMVVFGENHNIPTHIAAGKAALDLTLRSLGDAARVAVNLEMRHNTLPVLLEPHVAIPTPLLEWTSVYDPLGMRQIKTLLGFGRHEMAPVTRTDFYAYLLEKGIPTKLVDAAFTEDYEGNTILNLMDDLTRKTVMERRRVAPQNLSIVANSPEGMADRNFMMAVLTSIHMKNSGADVGFVFTGNDHVIGNTAQKYAFGQSLSRYLEEAGHVVIPVYNQHYLDFAEDIPSDAHQSTRNGVILRGLEPSVYEIGDEISERFHFEDVLERSARVLKASAVPDETLMQHEVLGETLAIAQALRARGVGYSLLGPYKTHPATKKRASTAEPTYRAV